MATKKEKAKAAARARAWRRKNPERAREISKKANAKRLAQATPELLEQLRTNRRRYHLLHTFDISLEDYERMFEAQEGVCAVCGRSETGIRRGSCKSLDVDHNHKTGAIRGLLCSACNAALGLLKEDPETITSLLEYLQLWQ